MLERRPRPAFELWNDALGQRLAELHAPLVEGIDVPDRALREDAVLVQGDQRSERVRGELLGQQHVGRAVAFHDAMRDYRLGYSFGAQLFLGLAERQRLGLGEDV